MPCRSQLLPKGLYMGSVWQNTMNCMTCYIRTDTTKNKKCFLVEWWDQFGRSTFIACHSWETSITTNTKSMELTHQNSHHRRTPWHLHHPAAQDVRNINCWCTSSSWRKWKMYITSTFLHTFFFTKEGSNHQILKILLLKKQIIINSLIQRWRLY